MNGSKPAKEPTIEFITTENGTYTRNLDPEYRLFVPVGSFGLPVGDRKLFLAGVYRPFHFNMNDGHFPQVLSNKLHYKEVTEEQYKNEDYIPDFSMCALDVPNVAEERVASWLNLMEDHPDNEFATMLLYTPHLKDALMFNIKDEVECGHYLKLLDMFHTLSVSHLLKLPVDRVVAEPFGHYINFSIKDRMMTLDDVVLNCDINVITMTKSM